MATTLTIGATSQIAKVKFGSLVVKVNTADMILEDPAVVPALGDAVTMTNPTWAGTVTSVGLSDTVNRVTGHKEVPVTATNTTDAGASAAPFNLSDAPVGGGPYAYRDLSVRTTQNTDGTTTTYGRCTIFQAGLWPEMTFTLTSANLGLAAVNYSVQNVTVTWDNQLNPRYLIEFGDPLVTMSVWANSTAAGVLPITTTKITDDAVTTPKLAAGSVTADKLEATLILGSLIETASTGARVELDNDGIRLFASDETQEVNMPTDGSPVSVTGQITASTLVASETAEFQGSNVFATNSMTTMAAGVQPPSGAPILDRSWIQHNFPLPTPPGGYHTVGISNGCYDAAGGAGGATACYVAVVKYQRTLSPFDYVYEVDEWRLSDGVIDRATTLTSLTTGVDFGHIGRWGITRLGTSWYIAGQDVAATQLSRVTKVTRSTGAQSATATRADAGLPYSDIANDATNLLVLQPGLGVLTWTTAPAFSASKAVTGLPGGSAAATIEYSATFWWLGTITSVSPPLGRAYKVTPATGAVVANNDFPMGYDGERADLIWDGTIFRSGAGNLGAPVLVDHTAWDWTTASSTYWVGYAWYDSAGTTHETPVGPRSSVLMDRRMRLQVSNAPIPTGGVDDPDSARVYMVPGATDPGAGNYKLQSTDMLTSRIYTNYASGGAADGGGSAFPGGVGGTFTSTGVGWVLRGDGSYAFGGNSFPLTPSTGDTYYRADLGLEFYFDGVQWLSLSVFSSQFPFLAISATSTLQTFGAPFLQGGSDVYLLTERAVFFVNGGTALSGSHSWVGVVNKRIANNTQTAIGTHTINSGSSSVWRTDDIAVINLLNNGTTYYVLDCVWTKTGTPGALSGVHILTYRLVAT